MPIKIFHLEYIEKSGEKIHTSHSYYTSLAALVEDNQETMWVLPSIHTLQRVKNWPYTRTEAAGGITQTITIRKDVAYTANDVRNFDDITPEDFE